MRKLFPLMQILYKLMKELIVPGIYEFIYLRLTNTVQFALAATRSDFFSSPFSFLEVRLRVPIFFFGTARVSRELDCVFPKLVSAYASRIFPRES